MREERRGIRRGRERIRERNEEERSSLVNINYVRTHRRISQSRGRIFEKFIELARRGVNETVNYHPLNNGAVYEFRHHVTQARSLRPSETLGAATSLLNFHSVSRRAKEREWETERERQPLVLINAWLIPRNRIPASLELARFARNKV